MRDTAPVSSTLMVSPLGRRQLESVRVGAIIAGKVFVMSAGR